MPDEVEINVSKAKGKLYAFLQAAMPLCCLFIVLIFQKPKGSLPYEFILNLLSKQLFLQNYLTILTGKT